MSSHPPLSDELQRVDRPFLVIALTGGIGTGKSMVASRMKERGAAIIDADVLARRVVAPGTPGFAAVVNRFGSGVVATDGSLNRKKLGDIVFSSTTERRWLEATLHPRIRSEFERELATAILQAKSTPPPPYQRHLIVYVVPLLFESGLPVNQFDYIVVVALDRSTACERIVRRDHTSVADAERRLAAQLPIEEKIARADIVIENRGTLDELNRSVDIITTKLASMPARPRG